jgi:hypothetical protein
VRIAILEEARADLIQGSRFYEDQEPGLGAYFLDCLFSDIDSLLVYAGIHLVTYYLPSMPLQAVSLCDLLQRGRGAGSCACCVGLSQKSLVDQKATHG